MSSSLLKKVRGSFAVRLNLWYASIFIVSTAILFLFVYLFLAGAVHRKDRELIESRLKEYAAIYESGGVTALRNWITRSGDTRTQKSFFVQVTGPFRNVLFLTAPEDWIEIEPRFEFGLPRQVAWVRIPKDQERDFTIAAIRLRDGSILQVGRSTNSREMILDPFRRSFVMLAVSILLLGLIGGALFAHRAMQPLRQIVSTAESIIETGDLGKRVPPSYSGDEFDRLGSLFNLMLEKNQVLIGRMRESLDNVAHDLRTPLSRMRGLAEVALQTTAGREQLMEALAECVEESERVLTILKVLMDVAEAESGAMKLDLKNVSLGSLIHEVIDVYRDVAEEKGIQVTFEPARCEVTVDPARIRQAFANLLDNALKYTDRGGKVWISIECQPENAVVTFADTGIGIPVEEQERIWERLYRGDKSRSQRGLGLGLSLVKAFVEAHHGQIAVRSTPGKGSEFKVSLPLR